jgi:two-component system NtrC family sensor kinase
MLVFRLSKQEPRRPVMMHFKFTISLKLLVFILPLVCLPIGVLGYFSIQAAEERVNRLVRHEQMIEVRGTAEKIGDIFDKCHIDLQTLAGLPVLEDYHIARTFRLDAEAAFNHDNIVRLFTDFISRSPYYNQIRYFDAQGRVLISVPAPGRIHVADVQTDAALFESTRRIPPGEIYVSDISLPRGSDRHIMNWAARFYSSWREFSGLIVIEVDYEKIIEMVRNIHVGENGYAFLVDGQGRNTAHPVYTPYQYDLETYPEPSLKDLVREMITGDSSWKSYVHDHVEKMAAFAPISGLGWAVAVTIPIDELGKEAGAIKVRVMEVAAVMLLFAMIGVSGLSYYLLRPVRQLVTATERISQGDLSQEIPVRSRDELGHLTQSFNRMVKNLARIQNELVRSEKLVSIGRLSAGVAHEIRNPLNAMKGAIVHLQRRRKDDSLIQEYTKLVSEEIDRLSGFVTEFLHFARQSKPRLIPTDLNQLIQTVQNFYKKQVSERSICMHNRLEPNLPQLPLDPNQMEQVLVNILINAMDALPSGGDITFSTFILEKNNGGDRRQWIRVELRDNGIGIPAENLQSVFDPFFSTKESGTGLGLPLSLGIVENHGGRMTIDPRYGQGTKVVIELPLGPIPLTEEVPLG